MIHYKYIQIYSCFSFEDLLEKLRESTEKVQMPSGLGDVRAGHRDTNNVEIFSGRPNTMKIATIRQCLVKKLSSAARYKMQ